MFSFCAKQQLHRRSFRREKPRHKWGFCVTRPRLGNPAGAFCFGGTMTNRLFYDPGTARPYVGFRLSAHQLAALDEARLNLRQGRSEFVRLAIEERLQRLHGAPSNH
ncbi:ribbon-helix-helix protein, CopG family [Bradyrhizobium diazoefficiens]|uniref:ribbon-helix-helix protein, CopG family n=2 Tax=Bradyrhizobium diazoefficiens TaxID=1355477 RepID=UPI00359C69DC